MKQPAFATLEEAFRHCRDMDASLNERLEAFSEATRYLIPGYQEAVDRMVDRLKAARSGVKCPKGRARRCRLSPCPMSKGQLVTLDDLLHDGPAGDDLPSRPLVPLLPHQHASSRPGAGEDRRRRRPACRDHARAAAIRGRPSSSDGEMHYPVLTDIDNGYALSLNLAIWVGEEMQRILEAGGRDVANYQGNQTLGAADPRDLRCRSGRAGHGSLHRSGLSQPHDDRGPACGAQGSARRRTRAEAIGRSDRLAAVQRRPRMVCRRSG